MCKKLKVSNNYLHINVVDKKMTRNVRKMPLIIVGILMSLIKYMRVCSFWEHPCTLHGLIWACPFIDIEEYYRASRFIKAYTFLDFWFVVSKKRKKVQNLQNITSPQMQRPKTNFDEKAHINLKFSAYLLGAHLP